MKKRSELFSINTRDAIRGTILAAIGAALTSISTFAANGTIDYKAVLTTAIGGAASYLTMKFFTHK